LNTVQHISRFAHRNGVGIAALFVGMLLILFAVPRAGAAFISLPASIAMFDLEQGKLLTGEELRDIEADLRTALTYDVETASLHSKLSYLALRRILAEQNSTSDKLGLRQALASVEAALKRRPLDAYLWTRYTHLSYLLDGLSPYTLAALDRSFRLGSKESQLFQFRMTLYMLEWERLPPVLREAALQQIKFGASHPWIWGYILADLPDTAANQLLDFLKLTSADTDRALSIARSLRRKRNVDR